MVVKTATCAVLGLCVGGSFYLLRIPLAGLDEGLLQFSLLHSRLYRESL